VAEELKKLGIELKGTLLNNGMILWPKPCPALKTTENGTSCLVYDIRPYPCRQFLCGKQYKDDPRPFKSDYQYNMEYFSKLIEENPEFAKVKEELENEAAEWGNKHGWNLKHI
jgi:Fe-S-cluster containining protein